MSDTEQAPETFSEYINRRKSGEYSRSIAVYVEGELTTEPPTGISTAKEVANRLNTDSQDLVRMKPGEVTDESAQQPADVGTILVTVGPDTARESWHEVQVRLLSRVPRDTDIVVVVDTNNVPWFVKELCDIRIVDTEPDQPTKCYQVKVKPWDGDVFYQEMAYSDGEIE